MLESHFSLDNGADTMGTSFRFARSILMGTTNSTEENGKSCPLGVRSSTLGRIKTEKVSYTRLQMTTTAKALKQQSRESQRQKIQQRLRRIYERQRANLT